MTTWILVGDAGHARLYRAHSRRRFALVREFDHPEGRVPGRELSSDRSWRMQQRFQGTMRSAMGPRDEAHELEVDRFAAKLAAVLREGLGHNAFSELILVAPPRFLGLLRAHLDEQVKKRVVAAINKDLTQTDERELVRTLGEQVSAV
jgi:protein required for attachment to host cells